MNLYVNMRGSLLCPSYTAVHISRGEGDSRPLASNRVHDPPLLGSFRGLILFAIFSAWKSATPATLVDVL